MNVWVQLKDSNRRNNEMGQFEDYLNLIYLNRVIDQASNNFYVFLQLANTLAAFFAKQRLFTLQNILYMYVFIRCTLQKISYFALTTDD